MSSMDPRKFQQVSEIPDEFLEQTQGLLKLEHEEEKQQTLELLKNSKNTELQKQGVAILKLYTHSGVSTGLYGRICAVFQKYNSEEPLPAHRLSSGDIVGVFDAGNPIHELKPLAEGVVNRVRAKEIEIVFSQLEESFTHNGPFHIAIVASDVTLSRYKYALNDLQKSIETKNNRIVDLCFGLKENSKKADSQYMVLPQFQDESRMQQPDGSNAFLSWRSPVTEKLNEPQQEAVKKALLSKDLHIILGPPGTGKTTTCVSFILECVARKMKLLVCAPSNVAVDNLLVRVAPHLPRQACVRIGHPSRVDEDLHCYTLDSAVASSEEQKLCRDIEKEIRDNLGALKKASDLGKGAKNKKAFIDKGEKFKMRGEISNLRKELRKRSSDAIDAVLKKVQVVFCTCAGASTVKKKYLKSIFGGEAPDEDPQKRLFDICLVDEAAQALEVACWIPLLCAKRGVLAGDHHQLAATVKSKEATQKGLDRTLFARMHERFENKGISSLLSIQYRMNEVIMGWSSAEFYGGRLLAAGVVKDHTLALTNVSKTDEEVGSSEGAAENKQKLVLPNHPLVFVDTSGNDACLESASEAGVISRSNPGEASLILFYLMYLTRHCGINPKETQICIITPYNQQVDIVRLIVQEQGFSLNDIPVNTVDSFQGCEADIVILSLVRSNPDAEVGFLADYRRLNVAVTRAKKHVLVIGNSQTICSDEMLGSLYGYSLEKGKVVFAGPGFDASLDVIEGWKTSEPVAADAPVDDGAVVSTSKLISVFNPFEDTNTTAVGGKARNKKKHAFDVSDEPTAANSSSPGKNEKSAIGGSQKTASTVTNTSEMVHLSDEEIEKRRVKYRATIEKFLEDCKGPHHDFPKHLNARERLVVHEICEQLGLKHESMGEGRKRFVRVINDKYVAAIVSEKEASPGAACSSSSAAVASNSEQNSQPIGTEGVELEIDAPRGNAKSSSQTKTAKSSSPSETEEKVIGGTGFLGKTLGSSGDAPQGNNAMLNQLARERKAREEATARRQLEIKRQKEEADQILRHKKLEEKKKKKENQRKKGAADADEEEDLDALLDEFAKGKVGELGPPGKCFVCKESVKHLDDIFCRCKFCKQEFCLTHVQAEVHGCGEAASKHARQQRTEPKGFSVSDSQHRRNEIKMKEILKDKEKERKAGNKKK